MPRDIVRAKFFDPLPGEIIQGAGAQIYVVDRGKGRPVVFIHGLGWTHALWATQYQHLERNYRVIAGDSRGHGKSSKPSDLYRMKDMVADWSAVLDRLHIHECALVGLSQGGMIAMSLAAEQPERCSALVLMATASWYTAEAKEAMEQRQRDAQALGPRTATIRVAHSIFSDTFVAAHAGFIDDFVDQRMAADLAGILGAAKATEGFDVSAQLGRICCPTMVIHGTADRVVAAARAEQLASLIPKSKVCWLKGAGHILPVERPHEVQGALESFLDEHYPSRPS